VGSALRNFIWAPKLGLKGMQRIHILNDVVVLGGAGVGGGSLNYANTLYEPLEPFWLSPIAPIKPVVPQHAPAALQVGPTRLAAS